MTIQACKSYCEGHQYYGLEYGNECYCGYRTTSDVYRVPDSSCSVPCAGDSSQICGGDNLLSLYRTDFTSQSPWHDWANLGCVTEPSESRALDRVLSTDLMTTNKCLVICSYGNFQWAGLEYGSECWCGNSLAAGVQPTNQSCSMPCSGDATDTCGGPLTLNLFSRNQTSLQIPPPNNQKDNDKKVDNDKDEEDGDEDEGNEDDKEDADDEESGSSSDEEGLDDEDEDEDDDKDWWDDYENRADEDKLLGTQKPSNDTVPASTSSDVASATA